VKSYRPRAIITFLALFVAACPVLMAQSDRPPSVPYCDLLSNPQKYDKQVIATQALVVANEHETLLYSVNCRSTPTEDRSASIELNTATNPTKLSKKLSKILSHDRRARVAFEGVFYASGGPYGQERTRFHFVVQRIVSAEEAPRRSGFLIP